MAGLRMPRSAGRFSWVSIVSQYWPTAIAIVPYYRGSNDSKAVNYVADTIDLHP